MPRRSHIASAAVIFNIVAVLCTVLWFYNITQNDGLIAPNIGIWLVFVFASWLLNILFLRKTRGIVSIVLLNLLFTAVQTTVLCLLMPAGLPPMALTLLIFASVASSAAAAYYAVMPVYSDHLLPLFELCFVIFIFLLWAKDYVGFSNIVLAPMLGALIVNLLAMVLVRVCTPSANGEGQSRLKGATVLLVVFLVLLLMVAVFSIFLAAPIGELALKLVDAVVAAFQQLMTWIKTFIVWLLTTVFGWEIKDGEEPEDEPAADCTPSPEVDYTAPPVEVGFVVIGLLLLGIGFLIYKLRNKRFSLKFNRPSTAWIKRFFNNFRRAVSEIWSAAVYGIQSLFFNLFRKNTLQGLFYYIERQAGRAGVRRTAGETPRNYLLRLADHTAARDAAFGAELRDFADVADAYFYAEKSELPAGLDVGAFRNRVGNFFKQHKKRK